jgi:hypothetical protein
MPFTMSELQVDSPAMSSEAEWDRSFDQQRYRAAVLL